jgi:hypothetical protein
VSRLRLQMLFGTLLVLYVASTAVFVRYFGDAAALTLGDGCLGVYWRGDREERDNALYNGGHWPLHPDTHYGGRSAPDRWEIYTGLFLFKLREAWRDGGFRDMLGFQWPELALHDDAACIVVPLGPVSIALIVAWSVLLLRGRDVPPGHCARCGYDLRATPNRCPECGTAVLTSEPS